jgi:hypothetical protein
LDQEPGRLSAVPAPLVPRSLAREREIPIRFDPSTLCRKLVVVPAGEAGTPGVCAAPVAPGKSRVKPEAIRTPFTNPPGSGALTPDPCKPAFARLAAGLPCFREGSSTRAASRAFPRRKGAFRRTRGAFHTRASIPEQETEGGLTRACASLRLDGGRLSTGCSQPVEIAPAPVQPIVYLHLSTGEDNDGLGSSAEIEP